MNGQGRSPKPPGQDLGASLEPHDDGSSLPPDVTSARQPRGRHLGISDFFRPDSSGVMDVVGYHVVTLGAGICERAEGKAVPYRSELMLED